MDLRLLNAENYDHTIRKFRGAMSFWIREGQTARVVPRGAVVAPERIVDALVAAAASGDHRLLMRFAKEVFAPAGVEGIAEAFEARLLAVKEKVSGPKKGSRRMDKVIAAAMTSVKALEACKCELKDRLDFDELDEVKGIRRPLQGVGTLLDVAAAAGALDVFNYLREKGLPTTPETIRRLIASGRSSRLAWRCWRELGEEAEVELKLTAEVCAEYGAVDTLRWILMRRGGDAIVAKVLSFALERRIASGVSVLLQLPATVMPATVVPA
jgi:hypothetical protein